MATESYIRPDSELIENGTKVLFRVGKLDKTGRVTHYHNGFYTIRSGHANLVVARYRVQAVPEWVCKCGRRFDEYDKYSRHGSRCR